MKAPLIVLGFSMVAAVPAASYAQTSRPAAPTPRSSVPYVVSRNDAVQDMLWMANIEKDDVVCDLGSGDGRIVIAAVRDFEARRAIGVEIDPERIRESVENAKEAGVADRVEFVEGDLFHYDFRAATVVTLFLGHEPNIKLRPKLHHLLEPGTRIVSHQFGMGEWQPDKELTTRTVFLGMFGTAGNPFMKNPHVPDFTGNEGHTGINDRIMMWIVPAPVAGIWRGTIETAQGPQDLTLILHQRLSQITGTFELSGMSKQTGRLGVDLWGSHLRLIGIPEGMPGHSQVRFDGQVDERRMHGTLAVTDQGEFREQPWQARRDKADFTGTWEWTHAATSRPVRLCIEPRDGYFVATYSDGEQSIAVTDFYDFEGGFYFTQFIGREIRHGHRTISANDGWLIGEATVDEGALKGTIAFHKYAEEMTPRPAIQAWAPSRIKP